MVWLTPEMVVEVPMVIVPPALIVQSERTPPDPEKVSCCA